MYSPQWCHLLALKLCSSRVVSGLGPTLQPFEVGLVLVEGWTYTSYRPVRDEVRHSTRSTALAPLRPTVVFCLINNTEFRWEALFIKNSVQIDVTGWTPRNGAGCPTSACAVLRAWACAGSNVTLVKHTASQNPSPIVYNQSRNHFSAAFRRQLGISCECTERNCGES